MPRELLVGSADLGSHHPAAEGARGASLGARKNDRGDGVRDFLVVLLFPFSRLLCRLSVSPFPFLPASSQQTES